MSEAVTLTEQDYEEAKRGTIESLVRMLRCGDALGKSQPQMIGEFMAAFNQAAEEATS